MYNAPEIIGESCTFGLANSHLSSLSEIRVGTACNVERDVGRARAKSIPNAEKESPNLHLDDHYHLDD